MQYGGAHVIDFIAGKDIKLYAESYGTDCYPRKSTTTINKNNVNQAMFNPRNCYQNYPAEQIHLTELFILIWEHYCRVW